MDTARAMYTAVGIRLRRKPALSSALALSYRRGCGTRALVVLSDIRAELKQVLARATRLSRRAEPLIRLQKYSAYRVHPVGRVHIWADKYHRRSQNTSAIKSCFFELSPTGVRFVRQSVGENEGGKMIMPERRCFRRRWCTPPAR